MKSLFTDYWIRRGAGTPVLAVVLLLVLAAAIWLVYRPGLAGPYVFDDFQNITRNRPVAMDAFSFGNLMTAAFSKAEGSVGRPIPMASFAMNYFLTGSSFDPVAFKVTNLIIHCINAFMVFLLARVFFRLRPSVVSSGATVPGERRILMLALFASALWALHPLQLTSVLYTVQRMTSMSAFFVLAGLLVFVHGRRKLDQNNGAGFAQMAAGIGGGTALGLLCKENAVLLPLLAATVELFFFERESLSVRARRWLRLFYLCAIWLPIFAGLLFVLSNPDFVLRAYATRSFTLMERVLTESRVLFFYVSLIIYPLISRFGLYHDDFDLSTGLLSPPSTLIAIIAWVVIGAALLAGARRRPLWGFGIAWFLVGHALESTVIGLEIVHEHRNYVPSVGLLIVLAYYLAAVAEKFRLNTRIVGVGAICVLLTFGFVTYSRAQSWSSRVSLFEFLVRHHPGSYRALSGLAVAMKEQGRDIRAIYNTLRDAAVANPSPVHPLVEMQKMIHAMIPATGRVAYDVAHEVENQQGKPAWAKDAVLDREYLQQLDRELEEETSRRLKHDGTHIETVYALWTAQTCAVNGLEHCLPLIERLLDWHLLTLERLPPFNRRTGLLELSAAKLLAAKGEVDKALAYVDRAINTMSNHPRFRAQKALLLLKLGATDEAEQIADDIEREMDWRKIYIRDLAVLRNEITKVRMPESTEAQSANAGLDG